jgi:hypothetical protein
VAAAGAAAATVMVGLDVWRVHVVAKSVRWDAVCWEGGQVVMTVLVVAFGRNLGGCAVGVYAVEIFYVKALLRCTSRLRFVRGVS